MKSIIQRGLAASLSTMALATHAHITLETREAPAASYYKAVFKVGHGCDGQPTNRIRVQLPAGVGSVKTMLKPGWKTQVVREKLATPVKDNHGNTITDAPKEVIWSGGRLADENYDEFVMQILLPDAAPGDLYFPVVQECVKGVHRWIEIPEAGRNERLREPAPKLRLLPKAH